MKYAASGEWKNKVLDRDGDIGTPEVDARLQFPLLLHCHFQSTLLNPPPTTTTSATLKSTTLSLNVQAHRNGLTLWRKPT